MDNCYEYEFFGLLLFLTTSFCFSLPEGFVYLQEVDPTILADLRYAGRDNFLGEVVDGYQNAHNKVILTRQAAEALSRAQNTFKQLGYSVVVYDAYRPQRAVNHFLRWSQDVNDQVNKEIFYPRIDKAKVLELGYIALERSSHSRGSRVDISLIKLGSSLQPMRSEKRTLLDKFAVMFLQDGTVDMGSSFDLFDVASHIENDLIAPVYKINRALLQEVMISNGFNPYAEEWWYFTLKDEPFPKTYFDFPVA